MWGVGLFFLGMWRLDKHIQIYPDSRMCGQRHRGTGTAQARAQACTAPKMALTTPTVVPKARHYR